MHAEPLVVSSGEQWLVKGLTVCYVLGRCCSVFSCKPLSIENPTAAGFISKQVGVSHLWKSQCLTRACRVLLAAATAIAQPESPAVPEITRLICQLPSKRSTPALQQLSSFAFHWLLAASPMLQARHPYPPPPSLREAGLIPLLQGLPLGPPRSSTDSGVLKHCLTGQLATDCLMLLASSPFFHTHTPPSPPPSFPVPRPSLKLICCQPMPLTILRQPSLAPGKPCNGCCPGRSGTSASAPRTSGCHWHWPIKKCLVVS